MTRFSSLQRNVHFTVLPSDSTSPSLRPFEYSPAYRSIDTADDSEMYAASHAVIDTEGLLERLNGGKQWLLDRLAGLSPQFASRIVQSCDEDSGLMTVIYLTVTIKPTVDLGTLVAANEDALDWTADADDPVLRYGLVISITRRS